MGRWIGKRVPDDMRLRGVLNDGWLFIVDKVGVMG